MDAFWIAVAVLIVGLAGVWEARNWRRARAAWHVGRITAFTASMASLLEIADRAVAALERRFPEEEDEPEAPVPGPGESAETRVQDWLEETALNSIEREAVLWARERLRGRHPEGGGATKAHQILDEYGVPSALR